MNITNRSRVGMIASMVIFGTIAPFVRLIPLSSGEIAFWRAVTVSIIIGIYLLFSTNSPEWKDIKHSLLLLLVSGCAMGINWILLFEAYKYTTVSAATLSYYFAPVIVMAVCPFIFREKMTWRQILCFIMATVGVVLMTGVVSGGGTNLFGIFLGLMAACFYAAVILMNKFIDGIRPMHRLYFQFVSASVTLFPYVLFSSGFSVDTIDTKGLLALFTVGLLHSGIAYYMYFSAVHDLPGQTAAILSYIDPLVAVLISVFVLQEEILPMQIVGGVMILAFSLWNEIGAKTKKNG